MNNINKIIETLGPDGMREQLRPHIEDIDRLEGQVRGNVRCCCPENHAHEDATPSLSIDLERGLMHCFVCGEQIPGTVLKFVAEKRGITLADLIEELSVKLGISTAENNNSPAKLTLQEYCTAKKLDLDFIKNEFKIGENERGLIIPYMSEDGTIEANRYRHAMHKPATGKDTRFSWAKGAKSNTLVYGKRKIAEFAENSGKLFIVEGESDVHTGWTHGLSVVGIPGKTIKCDTLAELVVKHPDIKAVYVIVEPDAVGVFEVHVKTALANAGYKGLLYSISLPVKDLSDLHLSSPDEQSFQHQWSEAIEKAEPVELEESKLLNILNNIRGLISAPFERQQAIADLVLKELLRRGYFIRTDNGVAYYFDSENHEPYIVDDNTKFSLFLYQIASLNGADADWRYLMNDLRNHALSKGQLTEVYQFCRYQDDKLYVSRYNGKISVLDGDDIKEQANGTDGVLFLDAWDCEQWHTEPKSDDFTLNKLICGMNFDDDTDFAENEYRTMLFTVIVSLFFIDLMPTRPLVLFLGEKGSGKTSIARFIGQMLFGKKFNVKTLESKPDAFLAMLEANYLIALDNVDGSNSWLNDKLATVATGGHTSVRKLYTTNEEHRICPRCFIWLTSRSPKFRRDDVADRLMIFRLKRIANENRFAEKSLLDQIQKYRFNLLGELLEKLNRVVKYLKIKGLPKKPVSFRMGDFALIGEVVARAMNPDEPDKAADDWCGMLAKMESDQQGFSLEEDMLPSLIVDMLEKNNSIGPLNPQELFDKLLDTAQKKNMAFSYPNNRSVSRRLATIRSTLETRFGIRIVERSVHGTKLRTIERI